VQRLDGILVVDIRLPPDHQCVDELLEQVQGVDMECKVLLEHAMRQPAALEEKACLCGGPDRERRHSEGDPDQHAEGEIELRPDRGPRQPGHDGSPARSAV
jgi:hypothetical protein